MKATLTKLSDNKNDMRTQSASGTFENPPTMGQPFQLFAQSIDPKMNLRVITTSLVQEITETEDTVIEFKTEFSHYRLETKWSQEDVS